jgi:phosphoenolpyruvate carboxykinase (ATP)
MTAARVWVPTGTVHSGLSDEQLAERALQSGQCVATSFGALVLQTGRFTGRSPSDRFLVRDEHTEARVDWGPRNQGLSPDGYRALAMELREALSHREVLEVRAHVGGTFGAPVRVVTTSPAHALFSRHLLQAERPGANFEDTITVLHDPEFLASPERHGTASSTFIVLSPSDRTVLIGGTAYAGEIKKAVFSLMNYLLPEHGILPMHAAVNVGPSGDSAVFFGLSGTGKTTLSADPERFLLGDDEHGWSDEGLFNLEGGCYAKAIGLREEYEPDIWRAVHRPRVVLENVVLDSSGAVDWSDRSLTENTRAAYPLAALPRVYGEELARHPRNVIFLTADAFGVLPPLARLSLDQAEYYFLSGYTAKLAGTELGQLAPQPTFSTCFGSPFMPRPPVSYSRLLRQRVEAVGANVWLVNTGWIGGGYGDGRRISIADTRRMVRAVLEGELDSTPTLVEPWFGLSVPHEVPGIAQSLLHPRQNWSDPGQYDAQAGLLAQRFDDNFAVHAASVGDSVRAVGPRRR